MTLITAWITPKFRIIASDSKASFRDGKETAICRKIFANNRVAVGIYGGSIEQERNLLEDFFLENPDTEMMALKAFLNEKIRHKRDDSHFVILPLKGVPRIWVKKANKASHGSKLETYKKQNQKNLPPDIFFSEVQAKETGAIDYCYQDKLLQQFYKSKREVEFDGAIVTEVAILRLFRHFYSAVFYDPSLYQRIIEGKIFLAFSINNQPWKTADTEAIPKDKYDEDQLIGFLTSRSSNN
ncbi:hypothetical protein [Mangrovibacterium marinum]|uniref:hypothetical protein n=1 Tax=Mangrovibacterium marinum TaxID=1639118 RepID=UPI002A189795|nr:hypothetical protein [Mangrovibacterium marinum]